MKFDRMKIDRMKTARSDLSRDAPSGASISGDADAPFPVERLRRDFPILSTTARGRPLVYLDSAATTQKPAVVIERTRAFYAAGNANIHRGVYQLSEEATRDYESARRAARDFLNARSEREIVFVRGTTEAINLVASSYGGAVLSAGDEIVISHIEHHSNIVPWQLACERHGARLRVIPMNDRGELVLDDLDSIIGPRARIVAIVHQSNALGTINPIQEITRKARERGAAVLIDGAQSAAHLPIDVQALDCDFFAFSGHKVYGPTGIGVLYGKAALLESMPPYQGGGDMIRSVTFAKTTYAPPPSRFEAGTPNIAGAIALGTALEYIRSIGREAITRYENELLDYATAAIRTVPGLRLIGTARRKASILSFTLGDVHPHDIGTILDQQGIAVRAGHHCAQPVMEHFKVPATARASLAFYNTRDDVDRLVQGLERVVEIFH